MVKVTIPAKIGSKYINFMADVIDTELPLSSSKNAMKLAIDFDNDIINIFGEDTDILFTESGYSLVIQTKRYLKLIKAIQQNIFY